MYGKILSSRFIGKPCQLCLRDSRSCDPVSAIRRQPSRGNQHDGPNADTYKSMCYDADHRTNYWSSLRPYFRIIRFYLFQDCTEELAGERTAFSIIIKIPGCRFYSQVTVPSKKICLLPAIVLPLPVVHYGKLNHVQSGGPIQLAYRDLNDFRKPVS